MTFTTTHRWNSRLCPPLGFLFNFALLWLILRRTPKEMRVHSRILLQTCVMDCMLLFSQFLGQVVVTFEGKLVIFFFDGYLVRLLNLLFTPSAMYLLQPFWFFLHHSAIFGISVQFIYRYLMLNRGIQVTLRRYLLLLLPQTVVLATLSLTIVWDVARTLNKIPIDREHFGEFVDFGEEPVFITATLDARSAVFIEFAGLALLSILSNVVIVFCGWKMVSFVAGHSAFNARLKELNRQLSFNLMLLAFLPFILQVGSIFYFSRLLLSIMGVHGIGLMTGFQLYFFLAFHWLPVLNPLASIFINRPYRNAVFGRFVKVAPTEPKPNENVKVDVQS